MSESCRESFAGIFELSASPQCLVAADGRIVEANRAARACLRLPWTTRASGAEVRVAPATRELSARLQAGACRARASGQAQALSLEGLGAETLRATLTPLPGEGDLHHLEIEHLESEAGGYAGETAADSALLEAYVRLETFTGMVAHDLRTPIGQIIAALDLHDRVLADGPSSRATRTEAARWVALAKDSALRMAELVDGLLQRARATGKGLECTAVDPAHVLRAAAADHQTRIAELDALIETGPTESVFADPLLLRQLFDNLLSNALKYRMPGRRPRLRLSMEPTPFGLRLCFADNGRGFQQGEAATLFDPFHRGASAGGTAGHGYGLSTCAMIAERHGWRISATGRQGEGATICLDIPEAHGAAFAQTG